MTPAQRALVALGGVVVIGSTTYLLVRPHEGVTKAQLVAAGYDAEHCAPVVVECEAWREDDCRLKPDGGLKPRYLTGRLQAIRCYLDAGEPTPPLLWIRPPRQFVDAGGFKGMRDCYHPIGDISTACKVVDEACTDALLCNVDLDEEPNERASQERCACRQVDAGPCRFIWPDGGLSPNIPRNFTIPEPFQGAGCVRKTCVELFGEESMPEECR